eukprot:689733-Amphidinium_carterae.3
MQDINEEYANAPYRTRPSLLSLAHLKRAEGEALSCLAKECLWIAQFRGGLGEHNKVRLLFLVLPQDNDCATMPVVQRRFLST